MKLLICTVVTAAVTVTLLSLTTAAVLPTPTPVQLLSDLAAPRSNGAVVYTEEFEEYYQLFAYGSLGVYYSVTDSFDRVHNLTKSTQGFNATVTDEIELEADHAKSRLTIMLYRYIVDVDYNEDVPMTEVAAEFQELVANGTEIVATAHRNIRSLVKEENIALSPQVLLIFTMADAAMTASWAPTVAYLLQFLPGQ